jgi:hypothetical protein
MKMFTLSAVVGQAHRLPLLIKNWQVERPHAGGQALPYNL